MKISRFPVSLALLLSLSVVACGGGGGGGNGPTEPPTVRSTLLLNAAAVSIQGGLQEASFLFDGREVFHATCNPASACQMSATLQDVPRGSHTVSIRVIRQSRASVTYTVIGQADFSDTAGTTRSVPLEQRQVTLRADEAVIYQISI